MFEVPAKSIVTPASVSDAFEAQTRIDIFILPTVRQPLKENVSGFREGALNWYWSGDCLTFSRGKKNE
jgi:hypothetical protein